MKKHSKVLSLLLACIMLVGTFSTVAFAAETPNANVATTTSEEFGMEGYQEIPVVFAVDPSTASPNAQGDRTTFRLGSIGYMSNCGFTPKFRITATGGTSTTQIKWEVITAGGQSYGPFGPITADGTMYSEKQFAVFNGTGTWQFKAYVSSGPNTGNIYITVEQVY